MKRFIFTSIVALVINSSCLHRQFVEGRYEIVSVTDSALNDSSMVYGHIHHMDRGVPEFHFKNEFEIWIENTGFQTTSDTVGYYSLKTTPGTYTINCKSSGNEWQRLIEKAKVELQKNKRTVIDFYIGYTIE